MLLDPEDLRQFQNHSSQMAALDFIVSVASNTFVPTYDGNMAKLVEGHRRYELQFEMFATHLGYPKFLTFQAINIVNFADILASKEPSYLTAKGLWNWWICMRMGQCHGISFQLLSNWHMREEWDSQLVEE